MRHQPRGRFGSKCDRRPRSDRRDQSRVRLHRNLKRVTHLYASFAAEAEGLMAAKSAASFLNRKFCRDVGNDFLGSREGRRRGWEREPAAPEVDLNTLQ